MQEGNKDLYYCYKCQREFDEPNVFPDEPKLRCPCGSSMIQQRVKKVLRNEKGVIIDGKNCPVC